MRIRLSCPDCDQNFSVSDEYVGKRVKCPSCGEPVRVNEPDEDDDEVASRPRRASSRSSSKKKPAAAGGKGLMLGLGIGAGAVILLLVGVIVFLLIPRAPSNQLAANPQGTPAGNGTAPGQGAPNSTPAQPTAVTPPPVLQAQPPAVPPEGNAAQPPAVAATTPTPPATTPAPPATTPTPPATTPPAGTDVAANTPKPNTPMPADEPVENVPPPELAGVPEPSKVKLDLPDLITRVEPSVVRINVVTSAGASTGSGYVVSTDGTVVTNYHVITDASRATVEFADGTTGKVVGFRHLVPKSDIAIIKIDTPADKLRPVPLSDALPQKGETVATFGAPIGLSFTTSEGIISAIRKEKDLEADMGLDLKGTWLQTTAPISPGNSGGPLVDKYGKVVGMNTLQLSVGQNLNFAVSVLEVNQALKAAPAKVKPLKPEDLPHVEKDLSRKIASDEFDTERGQKLLAEVKEIVVINGASIGNFDPTGAIWNRVILRSERAVEKSGIQLSFGRPRPDVSVLVIILEMNPTRKGGVDGTQELTVKGELVCFDPLAKKNQTPLARVWKHEKKVGTVSLSAAAAGKVPMTVDNNLADFFGNFRSTYNRAVKAQK